VAGANIIGKGWKFPIKVNSKGGLSYSEGPERIQDAIWIVLGTLPGERLMRPTFGAGVHDYVFKPNSSVVRRQMAAAISEALTRWEPRIELIGVRVEEGSEPSLVLAHIDYRLNDTNELFNLVYPLYVEEGIS
jgi:phage baseplate assembly protein W